MEEDRDLPFNNSWAPWAIVIHTLNALAYRCVLHRNLQRCKIRIGFSGSGISTPCMACRVAGCCLIRFVKFIYQAFEFSKKWFSFPVNADNNVKIETMHHASIRETDRIGWGNIINFYGQRVCTIRTPKYTTCRFGAKTPQDL
ncbi:hypothetical protein BDN70DRAFT_316275 [Pholiota conissans]|uniref:Uncharacterized protein n=1 Tax=Pholiota conissans TaxID=109636 RepID=A0A9P6CWW1_9AGAR|nr:hypothetical protein BDN70DRAFT_316275 [Pholiota conissans]